MTLATEDRLLVHNPIDATQLADICGSRVRWPNKALLPSSPVAPKGRRS
jgi:hypothetical protein